MKNRFGFSSDEEADERRYYFATAVLHARRAADLIGRIHADGKQIGDIDLVLLGQIFTDIRDAAYNGMVAGLGSDDWPSDEIDRYQDTFSDGSPVITVVGDSTVPDDGLPGDFAGELPWCPCGTALPAGVDGMGGTPAGCVILVAQPPHRREREGQLPDPPRGFFDDDEFLSEPSE